MSITDKNKIKGDNPESKFNNQAELVYRHKFSNLRYKLFLLIEKIYKNLINNEDYRLKVILQAIKEIKPKKILEIGSGTFPIYAHLPQGLKSTTQYYICEVNPAKVKYIAKNYPKIKVSCSDALNLPYKDNYFDFLFSKGVLHHIDHQNFETVKQKRINFLIESKRVLKNNGINLLMDFNYNKISFRDIFWHILHKLILFEGEHNFSKKDEVVEWLNLAGYQIIKSDHFQTYKGEYYYVISKK